MLTTEASASYLVPDKHSYAAVVGDVPMRRLHSMACHQYIVVLFKPTSEFFSSRGNLNERNRYVAVPSFDRASDGPTTGARMRLVGLLLSHQS